MPTTSKLLVKIYPWSSNTPQVRNGDLAELLNLTPPGAQRPYQLSHGTEGEVFWKNPAGGFFPCPNYSGTMASASKVIRALQALWKERNEDYRWVLQSQPDLSWRVVIVNASKVDHDNCVVYAQEMAEAVCKAAFTHLGYTLK